MYFHSIFKEDNAIFTQSTYIFNYYRPFKKINMKNVRKKRNSNNMNALTIEFTFNSLRTITGNTITKYPQKNIKMSYPRIIIYKT